MRYLIKYENYKTSEKYGDELTKKEFDNLYKKYCSVHNKTKNKLYRGIQYVDYKLKNYYYLNPKGHIRHSIEPENIHVILMSEMESWSNFPSYDQSIIGTNNDIVASNYSTNDNNVFEIIPFNNTKIGLCPTSNIWFSFGGFDYKSSIKLVEYFLIKHIGKDNIIEWNIIKDEIIKKGILKIENKKNTYNYDNDIEFFYNEFLEKLSYYYGIKNDKIRIITPEMIIKYIEKLFDPKLNNFDYLKYDLNFDYYLNIYLKNNHTNDIQVWCEGPVLLKRIIKK